MMPACLAMVMLIGGGRLHAIAGVSGPLFVLMGWCLFLGLVVLLGYFDSHLRKFALEGKGPPAIDHVFFFVRSQILVTPGIFILLHIALLAAG